MVPTEEQLAERRKVWEPVYAYLEEEGRSLKWLARVTGIPYSILSNMMHGTQLPRRLEWRVVCGAIGRVDLLDAPLPVRAPRPWLSKRVS